MIIELGKSYIRKFYGGNIAAALKEKDGILWTPEKIKAAFNNGNGAKKDFERYKENNKKICLFLEC